MNLFSLFFLNQLKWLCGFFFHCINSMCITDWFLHFEPNLNYRNHCHLIMIYNMFNLLLNSVSCYFLGFLHQQYSTIPFCSLLFYSVLIGFDIKIHKASSSELGTIITFSCTNTRKLFPFFNSIESISTKSCMVGKVL